MSERRPVNIGRPQRWGQWKTIVAESLDRLPIVPRNRWTNLYLHEIYGDDPRSIGLHDHPWWSLSIVLQGKLREYVHEFPYLMGQYRHEDLTVWRRHTPGVAARVLAGTTLDRSMLHGRTKLVDVPRVKLRPPHYAHALAPATDVVRTLFITGSIVAQWGFHTPWGYLPQRHRREAVRMWADLGADWAAEDLEALDRPEHGT